MAVRKGIHSALALSLRWRATQRVFTELLPSIYSSFAEQTRPSFWHQPAFDSDKEPRDGDLTKRDSSLGHSIGITSTLSRIRCLTTEARQLSEENGQSRSSIRTAGVEDDEAELTDAGSPREESSPNSIWHQLPAVPFPPGSPAAQGAPKIRGSVADSWGEPYSSSQVRRLLRMRRAQAAHNEEAKNGPESSDVELGHQPQSWKKNEPQFSGRDEPEHEHVEGESSSQGESGGFDAAPGGVTAFKWIQRCCPQLPYGLIRKLFRKRMVRVLQPPPGNPPIRRRVKRRDGMKRVSGDDMLPPGTIVCLPGSVSLVRDEQQEKGSEMDPSEKSVLWLRKHVIYKDADIIILNKPPGLACQGGTNVKHSLDSLMGHALSYDYFHGPRLVHRLDMETSGVMLLGRTEASTRALAAALKGQTVAASQEEADMSDRVEVRKTYWALVAGQPKNPSGVMDAPLIKLVWAGGKSDRIVVANETQLADAQAAVTEYRVRAVSQGFSWLELRPITGRKHQLRVHCASVLGLPIVGDEKYGRLASASWQLKARRMRSLPSIGNRLTGRVAPDPVLSTWNDDGGDWLAKWDDETLASKRAGMNGSVDGEAAPMLHLHCRTLALPVSLLGRAEPGQVKIKVPKGGGRQSVTFKAALPHHMAWSWSSLGFPYEGDE